MEWTLYKTEYFWGLCDSFLPDFGYPLAIGISIAITLKIVFSFMLYLKRGNKNKEG